MPFGFIHDLNFHCELTAAFRFFTICRLSSIAYDLLCYSADHIYILGSGQQLIGLSQKKCHEIIGFSESTQIRTPRISGNFRFNFRFQGLQLRFTGGLTYSLTPGREMACNS